MDFVGTGRRLKQGDVGDAARAIGIETAVLLAFMEVESAGRGFDSKNRPKMLFEPHVFWRNLSGAIRDKAVKAGLAYKKWKPGAYPSDSYPRLQRAVDIAREPGLRSASYGLPQILGENYRAAGFNSAGEMVSAMMQGEREQLLAMVTLLKDWGLAANLRGKDFSKPESWVPAVRRYNGSAFREHGYHIKCAKAFVKHSKGEVMSIPNAAVLVRGNKGEAVRNLQADLQSLGYAFELGVDGRYGDETLANVSSFQADHGLTVDGKAGPETLGAIEKALEKSDDKSPPAPDWGQGGGLLAAILAILAAIFKPKG